MSHFILVPLMAQGHMIPMVDLARLLATRGATVTFITTPVNAARIKPIIETVIQSRLPIEFIELPFPCAEAGLPEGCENVDLISNIDLYKPFFLATSLFLKPVQLYLQQHPHPNPTCMISDHCHPWTKHLSQELSIPRLVFHGPSCFYLLCIYNIQQHRIYDRVDHMSEPFVVPGIDPYNLTVTIAQAPRFFGAPGWEKLRDESVESEAASDGVVLNSFDELEPLFIESYRTVMKKPVWAVGPLSLYNKDVATKATRGNKNSVDEHSVITWLDSMSPKYVIYVNFGSLVRFRPAPLFEVGLGLEASMHPFIWVIKEVERSAEVDEWLEAFEERVRDRGLVVKGWAPQVVILSHPAVRGFLTHCGWNSTLEAVSAGVPMITWPHFTDQFLNERLIVDVLKIGIALGVTVPKDSKKDEVVVKREDMEKCVVRLMDVGEEGNERRERARELGEKARMAMEEGGRSYENLTSMIQYVSRRQENKLEGNNKT